MKAWLVARKFLIEFTREFQLLALVIGLPAFFGLITYVGYGSNPKLAVYTVLVHSSDARSDPLVEAIRTRRFPDGRLAYQVRMVASTAEADELLKRQEAAVLVDFKSAEDGQLGLEVRGDATSMAYITASERLSSLLGSQLDAINGKPQFLIVDEENLSMNTPLTDFEVYSPGVMIMAVLVQIPQAAMLLGREARAGTLRRLRLSRLSRWELLSGVMLAQMVIALVQVLAMIGLVLALGFHNHGSLILAVGVCLLLAAAAVGNGMWVAGFVSDDSQALNIGSVFMMIQIFLSGSWFPLPSEPLVTIAGHSIGVFDLLPATHAMIALKQVMVAGAGLADIGFRVGMMAALAVLYFAIGVLLFRRQMK